MVRHCSANGRTSDFGDDIVEAGQGADIKGGINVNPAVNQLQDILVASGMAGAGAVDLGQTTDQHQPRFAGQNGVDVQRLKNGRIHQRPFPGNKLKRLPPPFIFKEAVRLQTAHSHIDPLSLKLAGRPQHGHRFADTGGIAQKNLQPAPPRRSFGG
jgi:hypothetical protein